MAIRHIPGAAVLSLALAASTLTACSGGSSGGQKPVSADDLIPSLPAAKGDVDRITWNLTGGEPETLDPANAATPQSGQVVRNLCDSLLTLDAKYNLKPNLASYDQQSPTKLVLTIRPDTTFWDGSTVTAEDVAFSLRRAADPSKVTSYLFANVDSIKATAADKVTVTFKQPDEMFTSELANMVVLKKTFAEKAGSKLGTPAGGLMCSGPFKLDKWTSGDSITMSRNDAYWNRERRPFAKSVKFTFVTDATSLAQSLNAGEIDGAYELSASSVPALQNSKKGRLVFGLSPQSMNLYVARPDGVMADGDLRAALQRMIDREALAKAVYHGAATPLYTMTPPATWPNAQRAAYEKAYKAFETARSYDMDAAKKLVKSSSYKGQQIVLAIAAGDDTQSRTAQLLQQQGREAGLTIKIQSMQPLVYAQAGYDASKRKGVDLMLSSNFSATPDPLETIGFTFLPKQTYNYVNYDDPQATKLFDDARSTFDGTQRAEKIIEMQALYEKADAVIPLVSTNTTTFLNDRLTGAITSFAYWSMPQMAYVGATQK
ncbi:MULTISPECIES: ABC transporter substrate-binding protein [Streptomyces]|uniref:Peptide/nickel transport system substrate-binding protein n=1 Tax=Streptomyces stelliscabiei TaxID=146820 RepID=A0A8I0TW37_9ACTN|nr:MULTISPECIES: ABC transporter substrate-binding protein [Streptomyces]MBE1601626.1 peptide/nickel transport system substrate-binding protein [Streptomyces stelliscabiei]MDX2515063.1 ABC transporter substrate-binding protein [Streptomyces stelliscabiei]MDX3026881.1 ABC transporter substrate-binding protein [Streptomyces scabiei]MDX3205943.1 ABC transporter substrate-binding protein [Streptomyces scabiei]MDX3278020.1 ABC transporter substrate-binding protein [Streptomyces scabiei]